MKSESRREEKHSFVTCFLGAMDSHKIILLYFSGKIRKESTRPSKVYFGNLS